MCLRYLSHPCFGRQRSKEEDTNNILLGHYALADYATRAWHLHLEAGTVQISKAGDNTLGKMANSFGAFLDSQLSDTPAKKWTISKTLETNMAPFKDFPWFENGCQAIAFVKSQSRETGKGSREDDVLLIVQTILRIRRILESLYDSDKLCTLYGQNLYKCDRLHCKFFYQGFATAQQRKDHDSKHSRNFTCDVQGCHYEIIGCTSEKALEKHKARDHSIRDSMAAAKGVSRTTKAQGGDTSSKHQDEADHEDPEDVGYQANPADSGDEVMEDHLSSEIEGVYPPSPDAIAADGNSRATLLNAGYEEEQTMSDRQSGANGKSVGEAKSTGMDTDDGLPRAASGGSGTGSSSQPAIYSSMDSTPLLTAGGLKEHRCTICHKTFGRSDNLKQHQATHSKSRSHTCSICGKGFARNSDKQRHEKTHNGTRDHICEGRHVDGTIWGCRRRFARQDALRTHWKTHGSQCMLMSQEESEEELSPRADFHQQFPQSTRASVAPAPIYSSQNSDLGSQSLSVGYQHRYHDAPSFHSFSQPAWPGFQDPYSSFGHDLHRPALANALAPVSGYAAQTPISRSETDVYAFTEQGPTQRPQLRLSHLDEPDMDPEHNPWN